MTHFVARGRRESASFTKLSLHFARYTDGIEVAIFSFNRRAFHSGGIYHESAKKLTRDPDEDVRRVATTALARVTEAIMPPVTTRPDLFMLSVGIDRYAPPVNSLQGCVNDAEGNRRRSLFPEKL